ncbi:GNAT family N-acetyltransferase [Haloactinomyces albus]|uniref:Acetyltransferase n=1 Tax=Haloactinomyces albus TaxID=1352928 RepID=A0AAE3ZCI1_9ACTN|nr:GNAT family N-acetyltransferase [Haloactinomyces albus]MDR7301024.1 putative acetyltransferase [Haloactinomyces albus]
MADPTLTVHSLSHEDFERYYNVFAASFMEDRREHFREQVRDVFDPDRAHGVFDGDELIGVACMLSPEITLPGRIRHPLAAVTTVGVQPGHRRRGVLKILMRAQLDGLYESGSEPVAALYASEGGLYGRYGYGVGSHEMRLSLPHGAPFLRTVEIDQRPVREVERKRGLEFMQELYPSVAGQRIGWLSRDDGAWHIRVANDQANRDDKGALRYALHPDGYALYRPKTRWNERGPAYELHVQEVAGTTPQAYAALWRYLLDLSLVSEVTWDKAAVDEPVTNLLANPRLARRRMKDGLWVRLVDVDRALRARRYSAPLDTVLEITDDFCPWNAGRRRLRIGLDGVAEVSPTEDSAELALDVSDLAAAYLGDTTLAALARAGRITELGAGSLLPASRAFTTEHAPHCPEGF